MNPTAATFKSWLQNNVNYLFGGTRGLIESKYKPSNSTSRTQKYYIREGMDYDVVRNLLGGKESNTTYLGEPVFYKDFNDLYSRLNGKTSYRNTDNSNFGEYTVSVGQDDRGRYVSYWDKFDYVFPEMLGKSNPIEFYNRIYEDDFNRISNNLSSESYSGSNPSGKRFFKSPIPQSNHIVQRQIGGTINYLKFFK